MATFNGDLMEFVYLYRETSGDEASSQGYSMVRLTASTRGYGSKVNCLSLSHPFFGMRLTCHACFGDV